MRSLFIKSFLFGSAFLLAAAVPVAAQGTVGVGVSFLHDSSETAPGFTLDYSQPVVSNDGVSVAAVGDFGLNKFDGATATSYLGGVRVLGNVSEQVGVFGQFLLGAEHCCDSTEFAFQPGFGIDIAINPQVNFRAQVDFRTVRFEGENFNSQRYTFGISVPVGR